MVFIPTKDGSYTMYNNEFDEHYHSISGAYEEALEKHVKPLQIENGMKILDFCFGLGYNSIVATHFYTDLSILGLEKDLSIIQAIEKLQVPEELEKSYSFYRNLAILRTVTDERGNTISIIVGDAKNTIKEISEADFDRVFFDPFSPQKQPQMWDLIIFQQLYRILKKNGKLSTYSCAKWIRENMKKAGFLVIDGPCVGRKSPSTIAIKN